MMREAFILSKQCSPGEMKNFSECGLMKHSCVCFLGSGAVQADVLPLEQICGLLGQMGLTIAPGPKTRPTVLQGSATLAQHQFEKLP